MVHLQRGSICQMSTAEIASDIRIGLPADLGIERLAELRAQLAPTFEMTVLRIDGSAISRVHGATLQLLAAFCRDRRSEEHTSELQSLMRISYAVFCLTKKKTPINNSKHVIHTLIQLIQ